MGLLASQELEPGAQLGLASPAPKIDTFELTPLQAGWEQDVNSAERAQTIGNLVEVLDTPLQTGTTPGLSRLHTASTSIHHGELRGYVQDAVQVSDGESGRFAIKIHRQSGEDKIFQSWHIPTVAGKKLVITPDSYPEGGFKAMADGEPASRALLETTLNSVGSFFKEARVAAHETAPAVTLDTKTRRHPSVLGSIVRFLGNHPLHPK